MQLPLCSIRHYYSCLFNSCHSSYSFSLVQTPTTLEPLRTLHGDAPSFAINPLTHTLLAGRQGEWRLLAATDYGDDNCIQTPHFPDFPPFFFFCFVFVCFLCDAANYHHHISSLSHANRGNSRPIPMVAACCAKSKCTLLLLLLLRLLNASHFFRVSKHTTSQIAV